MSIHQFYTILESEVVFFYKLEIKVLSNHASLRPETNLSLLFFRPSQEAHYSLCQTFKDDLGPSGFDRQIFTILLRFFFSFFLFLSMWGHASVWNREPSGFMGHFTMVGTLMYYILTHHFYCDFCHMKKYRRQKSYRPRGRSERPTCWFVKTRFCTWNASFIQAVIDWMGFYLPSRRPLKPH